MEKKKTAMQELLEWTRKTLPMDLDTPRMIEEKIESLLEKERQQIINSFISGDNQQGYYLEPELYYEETYGEDN